MEFVSNNGEIVEAKNKAAFCREYGISNSRSLNNASGAQGNDGQRWKLLTDNVEFAKPKLYLGNYITENKRTGVKDHFSRSETADKFLLSFMIVQDKEAEDSMIEDAKQFIQQTTIEYNVMDNRFPDDIVDDVFPYQLVPYIGNEWRSVSVYHLSYKAKRDQRQEQSKQDYPEMLKRFFPAIHKRFYA